MSTEFQNVENLGCARFGWILIVLQGAGMNSIEMLREPTNQAYMSWHKQSQNQHTPDKVYSL